MPSEPIFVTLLVVDVLETLDMLDQSTGNSWLDVGEYALAEGGYPPWSR